MVRTSILVLAGSMLVLAAQARAQSLSDLFKGRWTAEADGTCRSAFTLQLSGDVLRRTGPAGHVDTQRVVTRRPTGIATKATAATHDDPAGAVWVYEVLGPGQIVLTQGRTGRSAELRHCHDPLPASTTPKQMVEAIYAGYAASDDAGLPLSSEANVRAFFVADLADKVMAFASHTGRVADDCRSDDPFVPGAFGAEGIDHVSVSVAPAPAGADHAAATASFRNAGKPAAVTILLDHTQDGWRITDVTSAPGHSYRAAMVACTTPPG